MDLFWFRLARAFRRRKKRLLTYQKGKKGTERTVANRTTEPVIAATADRPDAPAAISWARRPTGSCRINLPGLKKRLLAHQKGKKEKGGAFTCVAITQLHGKPCTKRIYTPPISGTHRGDGEIRLPFLFSLHDTPVQRLKRFLYSIIFHIVYMPQNWPVFAFLRRR